MRPAGLSLADLGTATDEWGDYLSYNMRVVGSVHNIFLFWQLCLL